MFYVTENDTQRRQDLAAAYRATRRGHPVRVVAKFGEHQVGDEIKGRDVPKNVVNLILSGHLNPVGLTPLGPDISGARSHDRKLARELGVRPLEARLKQGRPAHLAQKEFQEDLQRAKAEARAKADRESKRTRDQEHRIATGKTVPIDEMPSLAELRTYKHQRLAATLKTWGVAIKRGATIADMLEAAETAGFE